LPPQMERTGGQAPPSLDAFSHPPDLEQLVGGMLLSQLGNRRTTVGHSDPCFRIEK
jgi:hypothetical protein